MKANLKKEFIGPGLHLRPVCADRAWPPLQWTLNSVFSACGNDNGRIRPPSRQGNLEEEKTDTNHLCLPDTIYQNVSTGLSVINYLECNCGLIDYWLFEHIPCEWWGYCSCIYPSFVYVSLKGIGIVGLDTYTWGIKDFHKCWTGSLAKRRLCLGPTGVINCTSLSALSFWVSLFPRKRGYNKLLYNIVVDFAIHWHKSAINLHVFPIPIHPPTSLCNPSLRVFTVHQPRALVSCIQPWLVICFIFFNFLNIWHESHAFT